MVNGQTPGVTEHQIAVRIENCVTPLIVPVDEFNDKTRKIGINWLITVWL